MAWIRCSRDYRLSRRYGGIYWNYEDGQVYGVPEREDDPTDTVRRIYLLTEGQETVIPLELDFEHYELPGDAPVRCAQFWSGELGVLTQIQKRGDDGWWYVEQTIFWFNRYGGPEADKHFWDMAAFTLRHEDGDCRVFFFQDQEAGNIVRWHTGMLSTKDPGDTRQYLPWRSEGGEVRGMDFQDCIITDHTPELDTVTPSQMLVMACHGGRIVWMNVEEWSGFGGADDDILSMKFYKSFGAVEARDISDICIDRNNNVLYVLDSGNHLLVYELEPFGEEVEEDYTNTPRTCRMEVSASSVPAGFGTITVFGMFYDQWDQLIEKPDLLTELISGSARGQFADGTSWSYRKQTTTDDDGIFSATYRGIMAGVDEIVGRYVEDE